MRDMVPFDWQASRGHISGSAILPRSMSTGSVCEQTRQRKKAKERIISGSLGKRGWASAYRSSCQGSRASHG